MNEQMARLLDPLAQRVFTIALRDHRCGELLEHLFDGGSVTVDPTTGALVLISHETLAMMDAADGCPNDD